ncbi:Derepression protein [Enterobacter sp. PTB]|uniref:Derepression protein n=1 Tax=Enterobacter sp. PTB TaxID=3143437 RepID=UPI003DA96DD8
MDIKNQLSIESFHKLNRSIAVSQVLHIVLSDSFCDGFIHRCIPHMFSYIHEDITHVYRELKDKGLFEKWLKMQAQERNTENL